MSGEGVAIEDRGYRYLAYPDGRIKCYDTDVEDWVLMDRRISAKGYSYASGKCGEQKLWLLEHKLIALAFLGPTPIKHVITHKDKNRGNNHRDNLMFITRGKSKRRRGFICELA